MEQNVETALAAMLASGQPITADAIRTRLAMEEEIAVPELAPYEPALDDYDALLEEGAR